MSGKPFNSKLKALVDASTRLQHVHDALRSAGCQDLADRCYDLGVAVAGELGRHVVSNGMQQAAAVTS